MVVKVVSLRIILRRTRLHFFLYWRMYVFAAAAGLSAALVRYTGLSYSVACLLPVAFYLATGGWRTVRILCLTIRRDIRGLIGLIKLRLFVQKAEKEGKVVVDYFLETAKKFPNRPALVNVETGEMYTFAEVEITVQKIANAFIEKGYKKGDVVAILMESQARFVMMWLGLSRAGIISSLINHNLQNEPLAHCLKISNAKAIVYGKNLEGNLIEIKDKLNDSIEFYCYGDASANVNGSNLCDVIEKASNEDFPRPKGQSLQDPLFYVFTSGTTGLPKAAVIKHGRFMSMTLPFKFIFNINEFDVNYLALPLYHSNAGIAGVGPMIFSGSALAIRKRFSASNFFKDCNKCGATMTHYIGEVCRYLLAQQATPTDTSHSLRVILGNGMRPGIWRQFQSRFNIKIVAEFYGSTEGNANMLNFEGVVGAVGFGPAFLKWIFPVRLFRVDMETGELIRDANGLAIECNNNEPGQLVGKIVKGDSAKDFSGYINQSATSKKIARNVFSQGDSVFLSGDILIQDELGYYYFQDRQGDTFRWKGENVSTMEVETVISEVLQLKAVAVYGVEVPGSEGKAGMCAIAQSVDVFDADHLHEKLKAKLPRYAQPVFIRLVENLETTGTHKLKKTDLKKEGFNVDLVREGSIFFMPPRGTSYKLLDESDFDKITNCQMGF